MRRDPERNLTCFIFAKKPGAKKPKNRKPQPPTKPKNRSFSVQKPKNRPKKMAKTENPNVTLVK